MSFNIGGSTSGASASSQSGSKPELFGPEQLLLPEQITGLQQAIPSITDKALQGGFNPQEKARLFSRLADPVNRAFKTGVGDLQEQLGISGLSGGTAGQDISSLIAARIGGLGAAGAEVEQASREEEAARIQRMIDLLTFVPPSLIGQHSFSRSDTPDSGGLEFGLGTGD